MNEDEKHTTDDLSASVMTEINRRGVRMRSRAYFVGLVALLGIGTAAAFITALLFAIRLTVQFDFVAPFSYLRLGGPGLRPFLASFPWLSLIVAMVGLGGGLVLLRNYDFVYRRRFVVLAVAIVALVAVIGVVIGHLAIGAQLHHSRAVGPFLARQAFIHEAAITGKVEQIAEREISISTPREEQVLIRWDESTRFPAGQTFEVGQRIHAIGERHGDVFEAAMIGVGKPGGTQRPQRVRGTINERKMHPSL